jgi:tetratricopeptide (TPR) repeat protein
MVWNNRGFFLYKIGDHKAAVRDFNRALELDRDYAVAKYNLGLTLKRQEKPPQSLDNPGTEQSSVVSQPGAVLGR